MSGYGLIDLLSYFRQMFFSKVQNPKTLSNTNTQMCKVSLFSEKEHIKRDSVISNRHVFLSVFQSFVKISPFLVNIVFVLKNQSLVIKYNCV